MKNNTWSQKIYILVQKWYQWITDDPYYNPNLNLDAYSYAELVFPPRGRAAL